MRGLQWLKRLLDGARRGPFEIVEDGTRLVVCTRLARTAKGLLAYGCAGALVVDVVVAGSVLQDRVSGPDGAPVLGEDGASKSVLRRGVAHAKGLLELGRVVRVNGEDGPEELRADGLVLGVGCHYDGRLNEEAFRVVASAAADDLAVARRLPCRRGTIGPREMSREMTGDVT